MWSNGTWSSGSDTNLFKKVDVYDKDKDKDLIQVWLNLV